ncbi:MAG: DUF2726 domain-containing protein [Nitrosomonas sp.]|nr:DUF2726 domain-containing protein [Nitrosomonas sp.]
MNIIAIFIKTLTSFRFRRKTARFKYESLEEILSSTEQSFFLVLKESLSKEYELFAKVRITDVLTPNEIFNLQSCNAAIYTTLPKHFDYILCEKHTLSVIAVIELDERDHIQREARARSRFVEKACRTAGFKLLRFPSRLEYRSQAVREIVISSITPPA